jgi:excinuclease UvrABC nuclease subunit
MVLRTLEFRPESDEQFFEQLPASPSVFALRGEAAGAEAYISKTANLRRRARRLLAMPVKPRASSSDFIPTDVSTTELAKPDATVRRLNLRDRVRWLEYSPTGSDFESGFLLYKWLRQDFPLAYERRLRLRPAPLLRLMLENRYPRLVVTTRLGSLHGKSAYYGPFPTRAAAEKFSSDALDFFKVRRCTEELNPDPAFPGCIYSEMKMCLAPCFRGCTDEVYAGEVSQLEHFLSTGGRSLLYAVAAERDRASQALEFEAAAAMHTRFETVQALIRELPEIVHRLDQLRGIMIQRSAQPGSVVLFKIEGARILDPITFAPASTNAMVTEATDVSAHAQPGEWKIKTPHSMEARVTEALASAAPARVKSGQELMEHLSILKRWYYRSSKAGELFLADDKGELPMRRIVRGISRVLKGEPPQPDLTEMARDYWINRGKQAEIKSE